MQTWLSKSKLIVAIALGVFTFFAQANSPEDKNLVFLTSAGVITAKLGKDRLEIDAKLKHELYLSDVKPMGKPLTAGGGGKFQWVFAKKPSKPNAFGQGYCGAGTEDYIVLVRFAVKRLFYVDKMKVQSCIDNVRIDGLDDEEVTLNELVNETGTVSFIGQSIVNQVAKKRSVVLKPSANKILKSSVPLGSSE